MSGLRFLYRFTIPKSWHVKMIPFGKRPKKLPEVLGSQEVDSLLSNVKSLKHRTLMLTLYAAALRLGEASKLTIPDVDSKRMQLAIRAAKGDKDRLVPLSPRLLEDSPIATLSIARQDTRCPALGHDHSENVQASRRDCLS